MYSIRIVIMARYLSLPILVQNQQVSTGNLISNRAHIHFVKEWVGVLKNSLGYESINQSTRKRHTTHGQTKKLLIGSSTRYEASWKLFRPKLNAKKLDKGPNIQGNKLMSAF